MKIESFTRSTPCWIDLASSDPDGAAAFYAALFGWTVEKGGPETGFYQMCYLDGDAVAGLSGPPPGASARGWQPYLKSDDIEASFRAVEASGGSPLLGPHQVLELGYMAGVTDQTGASIGLWQPLEFEGMQRVGEPGAYIWSELVTSDVQTSVAFYNAAFGLRPLDEVVGETEACQLATEEMPIVGVVAKAEALADQPDRWEVYFVVDSLEDACVVALANGGRVDDEPVGLPFGRIQHLTDPFGASFGILQMTAS